MPAHALRIDRRGDGLVVAAPAKVNLFLEVVGRRDDGYHLLDSVFAAIDWTDRVTLDPIDRDIVCRTSRADVPEGPANVAWKAADLLRSELGGPALGVSIFLEKEIPAGTGLGGGSSDAAAVLLALNQLWNIRAPLTTLAEVGSRVGADVSFFLLARRARVTGVGERVEPLPAPGRLPLVIYVPPFPLATKAVYAALPFPPQPPARSPEPLLAALASGEVDTAGRGLFNRLESGARLVDARVDIVRRALESIDCPGRVMSGSGSAWALLCRSRVHAEAVREQVAAVLPGIARVAETA